MFNDKIGTVTAMVNEDQYIILPRVQQEEILQEDDAFMPAVDNQEKERQEQVVQAPLFCEE